MPSPAATTPPEGTSDGTHEADFFDGRAGYDPSFLADGLDAPWPGLPAAVEQELAEPTDGTDENRHELRYTHFGVKYHSARRQPLMTAVNIDGVRNVRIKRGRDKWFLDSRIPLSVQLDQDDYADPEIDRGHMVRREDPNWGDDVVQGQNGPESATAQLANDDTFHYVNAALQASDLNQGAQLWQGLENYLLDSVRTKGFRLCVFTGPVLRDDDPDLAPGLQVPREFWKVAAMVNAETGKLHATAYLLSQGDMIRDLLETAVAHRGRRGLHARRLPHLPDRGQGPGRRHGLRLLRVRRRRPAGRGRHPGGPGRRHPVVRVARRHGSGGDLTRRRGPGPGLGQRQPSSGATSRTTLSRTWAL